MSKSDCLSWGHLPKGGKHLSHRLWSFAYLFRQSGLRSAKGLRMTFTPHEPVYFCGEGTTLGNKKAPHKPPKTKWRAQAPSSQNFAEQLHHLVLENREYKYLLSPVNVFSLLFYLYCSLTGKWEHLVSSLACFILCKLKCFATLWRKTTHESLSVLKSVLLLVLAGKGGRNLKSQFLKMPRGFLSL